MTEYAAARWLIVPWMDAAGNIIDIRMDSHALGFLNVEELKRDPEFKRYFRQAREAATQRK